MLVLLGRILSPKSSLEKNKSMKRSYLFFAFTWVVLSSCLNEEKIDLASPDTFTRFYSDGYNNVAVAVEQTKDGGFIMIGNSEYKNNDTDQSKHYILAIKTDVYGNELWKKYYPEDFITTSEESGYIASSFQFNPDSTEYIIVGQQLLGNNVTNQDSSSLLVLRISDNLGSLLGSKVFGNVDFPNQNLKGNAATFRNNAKLFVAASDIYNKDFSLMELDVATLNLDWSRTYSQGEITLANKIFFKDGDLFLGGHGLLQGTKSKQFISRIPPNAPLTLNGLLNWKDPVDNEFSSDFCQVGDYFVFTGYNEDNGGDMNYYKILQSSTGASILNENQFVGDIFETDPPPTNTQFETGNSVTATRDGGVIVLGTITSYAGELLGRGDTDLILMKVNAFGEKQWSITYGSKDADNGNCIRQTKDGGYIVLGTTRMGGLRTFMLIKTDSNGEVN